MKKPAAITWRLSHTGKITLDMETHTTKNSPVKVHSTKGTHKPKNGPSTFSPLSLTRKNWTNSKIPTTKAVQVRVNRYAALVQLDTLHLKISEGVLPSLPFDQTGTFRLSKDYVLVKEPIGGKQYEYKAKLYYGGENIANILWGPRTKFKGLAGTAKMELSNFVLYDTIFADTWPELIIDNPLSLLKSEAYPVPLRADIALDSPSIIHFIEQVCTEEIIPVRLSSLGKATRNLQAKVWEGFTFGSRTAGRYVRAYNKTLELKKYKHGEKDYIKHYWAANDLAAFPVQGEIGRLEVELRTKYLQTVDGLTWRDLFDRSKLARIMELALFGNGDPHPKTGSRAGWFEWVPAVHTDSKLNRRERVQIVDFAQVKTKGYTRQKATPGTSNRMEKVTAKRLIKKAAFADQEAERIAYLLAATAVCSNSDLAEWLQYKSEAIQADIIREATANEKAVQDAFLHGSLVDLLNEVNNGMRAVSASDTLGITAGEVLEPVAEPLHIFKPLISRKP